MAPSQPGPLLRGVTESAVHTAGSFPPTFGFSGNSSHSCVRGVHAQRHVREVCLLSASSLTRSSLLPCGHTWGRGDM